jgi:hypothetical protein
MTPKPLEPVLLQSTVPAEQATEMLPLVTSRKVQELGGALLGLVNELELQFAKASFLAREYKTKFALPWRWPVFWFTRAITAANVGAAADVPPTA